MASLKISLILGLLLGVLLLPNADACWSSRRNRRVPAPPKEYEGSKRVYPFSPNAWEIEAIANKKFKPYVNKLKYINSTRTGEPCFGNGEGEYRPVNENELQERNYDKGAGIFMFRAIRVHLNEVADQYLSKYCKGYNKCEVDEVQNNYICVKSPEETTKAPRAGKRPAQVLKYLKLYLFSEYNKYYTTGETDYIKDKIETGKACVQPPYKLPFDKRPTKTQQQKMDKIGSEYLGVYCQSDKCHYDFKSKQFLCGSSSSIQPMALLIPLLLVTSSLLNPLFS